jgi:uncharacterized membrane protein
MNGELKYGDVALGVEAALPALPTRERPAFGYARLRRNIIWLYAALKRWA